MTKYLLPFLVGATLFSTSLDAGILWHGSKASKKVALTFDDGPKPLESTGVLDVLKREQVKASFFLVGRECLRNPDLVFRIFQEGHEIGNHTYSHQRLTELSAAAIVDEIQRTNAIIYEITGQTPIYFRPPGGQLNNKVVQTIRTAEMRTVMWDVNAGDYTFTSHDHHHGKAYLASYGASPKSEHILRKVVHRTANGSIILMHNGGKETIEALPRIIKTLRDEGFQFVTISELINAGNPVAIGYER